jgi:hypothetical protein
LRHCASQANEIAAACQNLVTAQKLGLLGRS